MTSRTPLKTKATSPSKWPYEVYLYATHTHKPEALYWDLHLEREPFLRWAWRQAAQISSSSSYSTYEGGGNGILLLVKNTSTWNLSGLNYCISYYVFVIFKRSVGGYKTPIVPPSIAPESFWATFTGHRDLLHEDDGDYASPQEELRSYLESISSG